MVRWKALVLCIIPGCAQLYVGHFWRAVFFFFLWMYGVNAIFLGVVWPPDRIIAHAFIGSGIPMALLAWVVSTLDAWHSTKSKE